MRRRFWHRGPLGAGALGLVVVACGGAQATQVRSSASSGSHAPPIPFIVAARYGAKSLGLRDPSGLAIGPSGDVYVTDFSQRVTVISPRGKVLERWGKPGTGQGEFHFISTDPRNPTDIHSWLAVGLNGLVYVADSGNNRVQVFTQRGRFVRLFGSFGFGKGQFQSLYGVAVDGAGNVYTTGGGAADAGVVKKFSPTGKVVWQIGGAASSIADLTSPVEPPSIDRHGNVVLVNDPGRVVVINRDGHEVDSFKGTGGIFPSAARVCGVAVDPAGYTYVTGCGRGGSCTRRGCAATLVFDRTHRLVAEWIGTHDPLLRSPVFGPGGEVFALGRDGSILKLKVTLPGV